MITVIYSKGYDTFLVDIAIYDDNTLIKRWDYANYGKGREAEEYINSRWKPEEIAREYYKLTWIKTTASDIGVSHESN